MASNNVARPEQSSHRHVAVANRRQACTTNRGCQTKNAQGWHDLEVRVSGGYFDVQLNGGWGHHFSDDPSSIWAVGERLPAFGVTQFLPTLISNGFDRLDEALDVLDAGPPPGWVGAIPVAWHLEGPWLEPTRAGAHRQGSLRQPAPLPDRLDRANGIALVTLAPELPGAMEVIDDLTDRGVKVSMGHSNASLDDVDRAIRAGAVMGTHLFNAMSGLGHRSPGLAAGLLDRPELAVGLIADGEHVAPAMVRLAWRLAGDRMVLVSDAVSLLGTTSDRVARLADGTLAGSTVGLDTCVRNAARFAECPIDEVVSAAASRPRRLLGVPALEDTHTDLDGDGHVVQTTIGGSVVFEADARC